MTHALVLSWWLLCGGDAVSTTHILRTGGQEALLPTQNPVLINGIIATQAYGGTKLLQQKKKTTTLIVIGMMGVRGYALYHNVRAIQQH